MRIYIIGNDGITLCREPPTGVNDGEIAIASNEELHAARLSGKRLPDAHRGLATIARPIAVRCRWAGLRSKSAGQPSLIVMSSNGAV
jgi:hypothetical protein